jgi:hypothetical protein
MFKSLILASALVFATLGMQACFWSGPSGQYASTHTVCDSNGNNCLACDDYNNCQRSDAQYRSSPRYGSSTHRVCDTQGYNCLTCDSNNSNCQSTARSSWGFIF